MFLFIFKFEIYIYIARLYELSITSKPIHIVFIMAPTVSILILDNLIIFLPLIFVMDTLEAVNDGNYTLF